MDLDIKRVIASIPPEHEDVELAPLITPWGESIDPDHVLADHPNPMKERASWESLNGWWEYAIVDRANAADAWRSAKAPESMDGRILVPFSPETRLSGVERMVQPDELLWYRRKLAVPIAPSGTEARTILHFEAVDWACTAYIDGRRAGSHRGGYTPFSFDITDHLVKAAEDGRVSCTLDLCVYDPNDAGVQLRGKQRRARGGMWYTSQSGIWQSVWLERVPEVYLNALKLIPNADAGVLLTRLDVVGGPEHVSVELRDADGALAGFAGLDPGMPDVPRGGSPIRLELEVPVEAPHLWCPDDPYLYRVIARVDDDVVYSWCAFRTIAVEKDDAGVPRLFLNHEPLYIRGLLDQGYWPESLMTAPSDEALVFDISTAKRLGFNMLRKHSKIESRRWYWHCDRLGMLVMQDVPSGWSSASENLRVNIPTLFRTTWNLLPDNGPLWWRMLGSDDPDYRNEWRMTLRRMVKRIGNHACVIASALFNESWGQFDSEVNTAFARELDPTRPILSTSGWYDRGAGDIRGVHNYFRSMRVYPRPEGDERAFMLSEFGGLSCRIEGHSSVERVYGYEVHDTLASFRGAVGRLLATVDALEADGLAGFVYTQISDVEEEVNGLLTYDRRLCKLEP
ncbi:MAG: glycoside hydrolase family 2 [Atopobiaceae bacterium]|nr:glycoside hydrolase family 2 [Atopobiaceae bacterium]